jgi:hypothetical protein
MHIGYPLGSSGGGLRLRDMCRILAQKHDERGTGQMMASARIAKLAALVAYPAFG